MPPGSASGRMRAATRNGISHSGRASPTFGCPAISADARAISASGSATSTRSLASEDSSVASTLPSWTRSPISAVPTLASS